MNRPTFWASFDQAFRWFIEIFRVSIATDSYFYGVRKSHMGELSHVAVLTRSFIILRQVNCWLYKWHVHYLCSLRACKYIQISWISCSYLCTFMSDQTKFHPCMPTYSSSMPQCERLAHYISSSNAHVRICSCVQHFLNLVLLLDYPKHS